MNTQNIDDFRDTALKLDMLRSYCPEDFFYIKGWIHCLLQKEDKGEGQSLKQFRQTL